MAKLDASQWILLMILGGLAGALGQSARVVIGLKKLDDSATAIGKDRDFLFRAYRLVGSVIIGFTAGALAALLAKPDPTDVHLEQLLAFAAAGYAGSDFIEGIISRVSPAAAASTVGREAATTQAQPSTEVPATAVQPQLASPQQQVISTQPQTVGADEYLG